MASYALRAPYPGKGLPRPPDSEELTYIHLDLIRLLRIPYSSNPLHRFVCVRFFSQCLIGVLLFGRFRAGLLAGTAFVLGGFPLRLVVIMGDGCIERLFLGLAVCGFLAGTVT